MHDRRKTNTKVVLANNFVSENFVSKNCFAYPVALSQMKHTPKDRLQTIWTS